MPSNVETILIYLLTYLFIYLFIYLSIYDSTFKNLSVIVGGGIAVKSLPIPRKLALLMLDVDYFVVNLEALIWKSKQTSYQVISLLIMS